MLDPVEALAMQYSNKRDRRLIRSEHFAHTMENGCEIAAGWAKLVSKATVQKRAKEYSTPQHWFLECKIKARGDSKVKKVRSTQEGWGKGTKEYGDGKFLKLARASEALEKWADCVKQTISAPMPPGSLLSAHAATEVDAGEPSHVDRDAVAGAIAARQQNAADHSQSLYVLHQLGGVSVPVDANENDEAVTVPRSGLSENIWSSTPIPATGFLHPDTMHGIATTSGTPMPCRSLVFATPAYTNSGGLTVDCSGFPYDRDNSTVVFLEPLDENTGWGRASVKSTRVRVQFILKWNMRSVGGSFRQVLFSSSCNVRVTAHRGTVIVCGPCKKASLQLQSIVEEVKKTLQIEGGGELMTGIARLDSQLCSFKRKLGQVTRDLEDSTRACKAQDTEILRLAFRKAAEAELWQAEKQDLNNQLRMVTRERDQWKLALQRFQEIEKQRGFHINPDDHRRCTLLMDHVPDFEERCSEYLENKPLLGMLLQATFERMRCGNDKYLMRSIRHSPEIIALCIQVENSLSKEAWASFVQQTGLHLPLSQTLRRYRLYNATSEGMSVDLCEQALAAYNFELEVYYQRIGVGDANTRSEPPRYMSLQHDEIYVSENLVHDGRFRVHGVTGADPTARMLKYQTPEDCLAQCENANAADDVADKDAAHCRAEKVLQIQAGQKLAAVSLRSGLKAAAALKSSSSKRQPGESKASPDQPEAEAETEAGLTLEKIERLKREECKTLLKAADPDGKLPYGGSRWKIDKLRNAVRETYGFAILEPAPTLEDLGGSSAPAKQKPAGARDLDESRKMEALLGQLG